MATQSPPRARDRSIFVALGVFATGLGLILWCTPERDPCEQGILRECTEQSLERWHTSRDADALEHIVFACKHYRPACEHLHAIAGDFLEGKGGRVRATRAVALLDTACTGRVDAACVDLGQAKLKGTGGEVDAGGARELFKRSCVRRHAPGCEALSALDADAAGG